MSNKCQTYCTVTAPLSLCRQSGDEPVSTLTQDFHTRLDNLLRTLVHAKPHFVRCIKANKHEQSGHFERTVVMKQLRALQVLETVNLMAGGKTVFVVLWSWLVAEDQMAVANWHCLVSQLEGLPHRMRFKAFNVRYRLLAPFKTLKRTEDKAVGDCKVIYFTLCLGMSMYVLPNVQSYKKWSFNSGACHIDASRGQSHFRMIEISFFSLVYQKPISHEDRTGVAWC